MSGEGAKDLVVLVHGWLLTYRDVEPLRDDLQTEVEIDNCDIWIFPYNASRFSNERLENISKRLCKGIEARQKSENYRRIFFLGHSIGGLIIRRAYLTATNSSKESPYTWGERTKRIVLIGTPNRGSSVLELQRLKRYWMYLMTVLGQMRLIRDALSGSQFITNLRLDWVTEFREREDKAVELLKQSDSGSLSCPQQLDVVQLICELDDKVNPKDALDVTQFGNTRHVVIKGENHESVIRRNGGNAQRDDYVFGRITEALFVDVADQAQRNYKDNTDLTVTNMIFLIHGIRTLGKWTEKAKEIIKESGDSNVKVVSPKYGFFPIIKFLWGPTRQACVEWFRDQYVQAYVEHPNARFNYIGHSNGTYILANTLEQFGSIKFDSVYFAGSVVPREFDWVTRHKKRQINALRNDCASQDLPVGFLCAGLRQLGFKKLGVGGYLGFKKTMPRYRENYLRVSSIDGHSAALNDRNFGSIKALVNGEFDDGALPPADTLLEGDRPRWMRHLNDNAGLYLIIVAVLIVSVGVAVFSAFGLVALLVYIAGLCYFLWRH